MENWTINHWRRLEIFEAAKNDRKYIKIRLQVQKFWRFLKKMARGPLYTSWSTNVGVFYGNWFYGNPFFMDTDWGRAITDNPWKISRPDLSTITPSGVNPLIWSGIGITAHSVTAGWCRIGSSRADVDNRWPATLMTSSARDITLMYPSMST